MTAIGVQRTIAIENDEIDVSVQDAQVEDA
jgi:hypothetical protein